MRVSDLYISNIRAFESAHLQFSPHINLLIGANNAGKSTIIRSIYKLQEVGGLDLPDVRKQASNGKIEIDLRDISESDSLAFADKRSDQIPSGQSARVVFGLYPDNRFDTASGRQTFFVDQRLEGQVRKDDYDSMRLLPFAGFPKDEKKGNFIYPIFSRRKYYYGRQVNPMKGFEVSSDLTNIVSKVSHISTSGHPWNKRFNSIINDILGFEVGVVPIRENESNIGLFTSTTQVVHMEQMGDGVFNIVAIVTLLLTENNKLYLIEEPETDLHPAALKKLMDLIIQKSANNQFIISTHSNIVLKYLASQPEAKIFEISSDEQRFRDSNIPTSVVAEVENNTAERLRILEKLGYDFFDLDLYKYYFLFEESSAEKIIKDFLIPEFVPSLRNKVRTIAAKGTDDLRLRAIDFERLFVYLHQEPIYQNRAWIFADGDDAGIKAIAEVKSKFNCWDPEHFINFTQPYFEYYYPQRFREEFDVINSSKNKNERWKNKIAFTQKVVDWIENHTEVAKQEFADSAKEVIGILTQLQTNLIR